MSTVKIKQLDRGASGTGAVVINDGAKPVWSDASDGALALPAGPESARPAGSKGLVRINTDTDPNTVEYWDVANSKWVPVGSGESVLGNPTDGSFNDPAYTGGPAPAVPLTPDITIADAVDNINTILGLLSPTAPGTLEGQVITISGTTSALLVTGATNNTGVSAPAAGSTVSRVTGATVSSSVIQDRGPGTSGTVSLFKNGAPVAGESMAFTRTTGEARSGALTISDNKWTTPAGFYQTFDTQIVNLAVSKGVNNTQVRHTAGGNTAVTTFVTDDLTALPAVTNLSVAEASASLAYSSGIPHYNSGSTLATSATLSNLAGQTYKSGTIIELSGTGSIGSTLNYAAGAGGLPAILTVDTLSFDFGPQNFVVGTNQHTSGVVQLRAANPAGFGSLVSSTKTVLVKAGTALATQVDELSVPVSGLGSNPNTNNAVRVSMPTGDTPADNGTTAWVSSAALASHEAAVVGGILRHSVTDFSTNYLPVGPNLSSHDATQYVTFAFNRAAVSKFKIVVTGTYSGCQVKLPGIPSAVPNAPNGWWNAYSPYIGSGVPGRAGDTGAGCAEGTVMNGAGGTFTITFGTESSSNATSNLILVRFKLTAGQSISALRFTNS